MNPANPTWVIRQRVICPLRLFWSHIRCSNQQRAFATTTIQHVVSDRRRPFRLAVIGAGPSGFYTAQKILSKIENSYVDMYERLPVPYGLVRYGVAPDHPEVKNCQEKFNEIAQSPRFVYVGNISIGEGSGSIPLKILIPHYHAILFAYGASRDRKLGIPGEETFKGIYSAREFVAWYNGQPGYSDLSPDLTTGEEAVVIGQGNVALDVARILLQNPKNLSSTDITENALETLRNSKIKKVRVLGRRGPVQAAYTIKEIRELTKLSSVKFNPISSSLIPPENIIKDLPRARRRIMELLQKISISSTEEIKSSPRSVSLEFCLAPRAFKPSLASHSHLSSITFERTSLIPNPHDLGAKAIGKGEVVDINASLALVSVGYKSEALSDFKEVGLPFSDSLGIIPNDHAGRVVHENNRKHIPGMYCAGWVKTGPIGVIATTMEDAFMTAEAITSDWNSNVPFLPVNTTGGFSSGWVAIKKIAEQRGCRRVSWQDWKKIDRVERENGRVRGKEREKFIKKEDMLAILD